MRTLASALVVGLVIAGAPLGAESQAEKVAKLVKKLATDNKPENRIKAAEDLVSLQAWDQLPAFAAALKDPSPDVREAVVSILFNAGAHAEDAAPALKEAMRSDSDRLVRYNSTMALFNMKKATSAELAPSIVGLLDGADKDDVKNLTGVLVGLGLADPTARKIILDTLEHGPGTVRAAIFNELSSQRALERDAPWKPEVVNRLVTILQGDKDPKMRHEALYGLENAKAIGVGPVGNAVLKALDDPDGEVVNSAAAFLNHLEHNPLPIAAVDHLIAMLRSPDPGRREAAARAFNHIFQAREKVSPVLIAVLLGDKEPRVRLAVVDALTDTLVDDAATPSLIKALTSDPDAQVKARICTQWAEHPNGAKGAFERTHTVERVVAALEAARKDPELSAEANRALEELELKK